MTAAAAAAASSPSSGRLIAIWGHAAPELLVTSIGAAIIVGVRPLPGMAGLVVPIALMAFVLVNWMLLRKHDRTLCERCVTAMPLNPSKLAENYRWRFWMSHTGAEKRVIIPYMIVLIGSNFITGTTPGLIAWAIIQASMIFLVLSYSTHRRFQPWCPWCSDGGGGSEQDEVDPVTPDPAGKRLQLT
ncbi:MAG TPA: hypothetical protein VJ831_05490 [Jatrophihabitantaceae bacterium]|nr:hypothetical protein [Jatrophihabitantaceae bacterium]